MRVQLEKTKSTLETANLELSNELKTAQAAKQESEKRRKQAETQLMELSAKLADSEKTKIESVENFTKVQVNNFLIFV